MDKTLSGKHAERFREAWSGDGVFDFFPGGDHDFSDERVFQEAMTRTVQWLKEQLG
ncbi:MAG: hypothetical protein KDK65_06565 [Chlamydiia bacterium]|nr:hypothetical protein [Chlamydiia bacterium]